MCWKQKNEICVNYSYLVFIAASTNTMLSNYRVKYIHFDEIKIFISWNDLPPHQQSSHEGDYYYYLLLD